MKKLLLLLAFSAALPLFADDRIRDVQTELKTQGFYYGEADGNSSPETTAAIRRYQIRNGLEVTGTLTDETSKSLHPGSAPAQPPPAQVAPPKPPQAKPRSTPIEESDRKFLRREEARQQPPAPQITRPPADEPAYAPGPRRDLPPSASLSGVFADTPYATAPREVQVSTLRRAQALLADRGFYRSTIDGDTGPATEEAIFSYQRAARLPLSGRLDLETLVALRLVPGRSPVPLRGFYGPRHPADPPVYRGIWVR